MSVGALVASVALLLANGFFVAMEFAVLASRRTKIEPLADAGRPAARQALGQLTSLNLQLTGAQLGITMSSLLLGYVAEPAVATGLESLIEQVVELPSGVLHAIGVTLALLIVVFFHMVIGEMVPKNMAITAPERTLLALALPNALYVTVFRPVLRAFTAVANAGVRLLGAEPRDELTSAHSAEELASMLTASRRAGLIEDVSHRLLTGALDLPERTVGSVMIGRDDVAWVDRSSTVAEVEDRMRDTGRSRLLVADGGLDAVLGFIHAKDLLPLSDAIRTRPLPLGRVRRMPRLRVSEPLVSAMVAMQRAQIHVAVVESANGRTVGLVTLEDVLEALVGDIRDETDPGAGSGASRLSR